MHLKRASLIGLLIIGVAHAAAAQQKSADVSRVSTSVDVNRLPIDLAKITRQLRQTQGTQSNTGLHIRYTIDVYGAAPRIEFFTKADNLQVGPVPYGAPTHHEMISHVTPQEFSAPVADVGALIQWLADRHNKK